MNVRPRLANGIVPFRRPLTPVQTAERPPGGPVRQVIKKHCHYELLPQGERVVVTARPLSRAAEVFLSSRRAEALRQTCPDGDAHTWIRRTERAIECFVARGL